MTGRGLNAEGLLGIYYVLDFGAVGDGQHDDSVGIQAAIAAAAAGGGGLIAIPAGTYRLTQALSWLNATNVTIWQHSGASFTGAGSLPAPAGSNSLRVEPSGATIGGVPTTSAVGDAAGAGSATTASATDHRHGREAFGGAPVTQAFADAAAAGAAATPSRSDHRHGMPANPLPLSDASARLNSDVAMTNANTAYDGPSITPPAGRWLIGGAIELLQGGSGGGMNAKLWDGTTVLVSGEKFLPATDYASIPLPAFPVTTDGSKTYKITALNAQAGGTIKAANLNNGAGNNATSISAVRMG